MNWENHFKENQIKKYKKKQNETQNAASEQKTTSVKENFG